MSLRHCSLSFNFPTVVSRASWLLFNPPLTTRYSIASVIAVPLPLSPVYLNKSPLKSITYMFDENVNVLSPGDICEKQKQYVNALISALETMHKDVAFRSIKNDKLLLSPIIARAVFARSTLLKVTFLRDVLQRESSRQPSLKWLGTYRVV